MLIKLTDSCLENIDNNRPTLCVFIDLKKAFDTICHKKLVSKLKRMNITDKALEFFTNYLDNRQQQTVVNDCKSELRQMTVGVPQGSILGPVLFTLYINDIVTAVTNSQICLFADDTVTHHMKISLRPGIQYNETLKVYRNGWTQIV